MGKKTSTPRRRSSKQPNGTGTRSPRLRRQAHTPGPVAPTEFVFEGTAHIHPDVEGLVPAMDVEQYAALREDIQRHGQREAIIVVSESNAVLTVDGVHRQRVCGELGVPCRAREWDGQIPLKQLCLSLNIPRRHLTPSQLALVAAEHLLPDFEREAKARQAEGRSQGGKTAGRGRPKESSEEGPPQTKRQPQASDSAGKVVGVSGKLVRDAKSIVKHAPELIQNIKDAVLTVERAKPFARRLARMPEVERMAVVARAADVGFVAALKECAVPAAQATPDQQSHLRGALRAAEKLRAQLRQLMPALEAGKLPPAMMGGVGRLHELLGSFAEDHERLGLVANLTTNQGERSS